MVNAHGDVHAHRSWIQPAKAECPVKGEPRYRCRLLRRPLEQVWILPLNRTTEFSVPLSVYKVVLSLVSHV